MNDQELFHNKTAKKIKRGAPAKQYFRVLLPFTPNNFFKKGEVEVRAMIFAKTRFIIV